MTSDQHHMPSTCRRSGSGRRRLLALSAALAALAFGAPVSAARAAIVPGVVGQGGQANGPSGCVDASAPSGVGDAGAAVNQICGVTAVFVGPTTGQLASAVGPTIIGSTVLAPVTVTTGTAAISWLR
jgi:hypothetical protein